MTCRRSPAANWWQCLMITVALTVVPGLIVVSVILAYGGHR